MLTIASELSQASLPMVDVPDVNPDFSAPFMTGLQVLASYVFAGALIIILVVLIIAICSLAFRGVTPERMQSWAGENLGRIFIAVIILGSVNGIFAWLINFDFGF